MRDSIDAAMKIRSLLLALSAFLLSSCALLPTPAPPPAPTWTPSLSPTATATPFAFPPTHTPAQGQDGSPAPGLTGTAPVITATATSAGPTPTFDAAAAATRRPAQPALCPPRIVGIQADESGWDELMGERRTADLLEALQFYLNQGGSFETAADALREYRGRGGLGFFRDADLTGDGISELLASDEQVHVFWCEAGFVELRVIPEAPPDQTVEVLFIGDLNITGVPEIVLYWGEPCEPGPCGALAVVEWDGEAFVSLVDHRGTDLARMDAVFDARFRDIEGNGTVEILLDGEIPDPASTRYRDGLPWRERFDTYMWNGENFVLAQTRYDTPVYRFQAVQDGDRLTLQGDYELAQQIYQNVIFGVALDWWSPERAEYLKAVWDVENEGDVEAPTPPDQDPAEFEYLSAYARFRLMLLYLLQGWMGDAETVYESLVLTYPEGETGDVFAWMAAAFWENYQETESFKAACSAAAAVAERNPDALAYLGAEYHGAQSEVYAPGDVCPFGD